MDWTKILLTVAVVNLVALNGWAGYSWWNQKRTPAAATSQADSWTVRTEGKPEDAGCGQDCRDYIDAQLAKQATASSTIIPTASIQPSATPKAAVGPTAAKTKVRSVAYVTIPGTGSTGATAWTDLSGTDFYFDTAEYPGLVEIYFEATVKLVNGNGTAFVRLLDVTHGIGVTGSDVSSQSQQNTVAVSGKVSFWRGRNLIRVQARSLTADTTVFSSGRLKVVTEN